MLQQQQQENGGGMVDAPLEEYLGGSRTPQQQQQQSAPGFLDAANELVDLRLTSRTPPPPNPYLNLAAQPPPRSSSTPPMLHAKQSNPYHVSPLQREYQDPQSAAMAADDALIAAMRQIGLDDEMARRAGAGGAGGARYPGSAYASPRMAGKPLAGAYDQFGGGK